MPIFDILGLFKMAVFIISKLLKLQVLYLGLDNQIESLGMDNELASYSANSLLLPKLIPYDDMLYQSIFV